MEHTYQEKVERLKFMRCIFFCREGKSQNGINAIEEVASASASSVVEKLSF